MSGTSKRQLLTPLKRKHLGYDDILDDDLKREAKRRMSDGCIPLGTCKHLTIKPNLLGPILKKRFMGTNSLHD